MLCGRVGQSQPGGGAAAAQHRRRQPGAVHPQGGGGQDAGVPDQVPTLHPPVAFLAYNLAVRSSTPLRPPCAATLLAFQHGCDLRVTPCIPPVAPYVPPFPIVARCVVFFWERACMRETYAIHACITCSADVVRQTRGLMHATSLIQSCSNTGGLPKILDFVFIIIDRHITWTTVTRRNFARACVSRLVVSLSCQELRTAPEISPKTAALSEGGAGQWRIGMHRQQSKISTRKIECICTPCIASRIAHPAKPLHQSQPDRPHSALWSVHNIQAPAPHLTKWGQTYQPLPPERGQA